MNYEKQLKQILAKRGIEKEEDIQKFLYPNISDFYDPFLLKSMHEAVDRIEIAIAEQQTILIYGDYDADGICSVSILFLYLKSRGIDPIVFIPNRHTDGYGLNEELIEKLSEEYFPDLFITVDTGISAKNEIDLLNELGIDCIVTDHHEPSNDLPNCIVVDPKIPNQNYPFNGLSGAGVVFKLVTALGGLENAMQYIDICAISTIGDIVPLLDENRIITTLGLQLINSEKCRPSIKYFKDYLGLHSLSSTDVSFKIVPRLNASGRMDSCLKCFYFLISDDLNEIKEIFSTIEEDNNERLKQTNESISIIEKSLKDIDINNTPAIFVRQDELNLGIIGIVASRLCSTYNRPVFVFTKSEDGNLKCSVRSIESINIFNCLEKYKDIMIDIGGHALAGGLTIKPENYDKLFNLIQTDIKQSIDICPINTAIDYDLIIDETFINLDFLNTINRLEPFGCQNLKPTFLFRANDLTYENMKSFKHYKIITKSKKEILSFFGNKYVPYFENNLIKNIYFQMDYDEFSGKKKVKSIAKKITVDDIELIENSESPILHSLYYKILSLKKPKKNSPSIKKFNDITDIQDILNKNYSTLIICNKNFKNLPNNIMIDAFPSQLATTQIVNTKYTLSQNQILMYKNLVFYDGYLFDNQFDCFEKNIFVLNNKLDISKYKINRELFAKYFTSIRKFLPMESNNFIELLDKLQYNNNLDKTIMAIVIAVSLELGFFAYENSDSFKLISLENVAKKELSLSEIYNCFKGE